MTIGTLIYLLIVLAGFLISVFCLQYGTVAVVGALLVIPFFMIFFLILLRVHISAEVECKNPVAEKDSLEKRDVQPLHCHWKIQANGCRLQKASRGCGTGISFPGKAER